MRRLFLVALSTVLIVGLCGCICYGNLTLHVTINPNGSVTCIFRVYNIGTNSVENLSKDYQEFKNDVVEGNDLGPLKSSSQNGKVVFKKIWIEDGATNVSATLIYPDLKSFLDESSSGHFKFKQDEEGGYYVPVSGSYSDIIRTNGEVKMITEDLNSIVWAPGTTEFYYTLKGDYSVVSFTKSFYIDFGPSKTCIFNDQ